MESKNKALSEEEQELFEIGLKEEAEKAKEEKIKKEAERIKSLFKIKSVLRVAVEAEEGEDRDEFVCWLRKPTLKEYSAHSSLISKDVITAYKLLLNECMLEGDVEFKTNDDIFLGALPSLETLLEVRGSSVKKL